MESVVAIKNVLSEFSSLSGLQMNPDKCTVFCAGISQRAKEKILACLQVREGYLPVCYLGVPLISTCLAA